VRIEHKPSKDYASHTATGGLLSGPTSDGFYHLIPNNHNIVRVFLCQF
jgi:hypothetical protein